MARNLNASALQLSGCDLDKKRVENQTQNSMNRSQSTLRSVQHLATILCLGFSIYGQFVTAATAEWPRFRGVGGAGVSDGSNLPADFGPDVNLAWKTPVPEGCSSPVIAGNHIWVAGYEGNHRYVSCLDLSTGRLRWQRPVEAVSEEHKSPPNDAASSTPVTDGLNIYALFSGFGLVSYDENGHERWRVRLGPFTQPHGMASSPILAADQVIVLADQIQDSFLAAFDTKTGRQKWRAARPNFVGGYSTPVLWGDQIVVAGPIELDAYAPATGARLWSLPKLGVMPIGSPALAGGRIFVNNGAVPPFEALAKMANIGPNGNGKITADQFPDPSFKEAVLAIDRAYGNGDGAIDKSEWDGALKLMETLNTLVAVQLSDSAPKELWRSAKILADVASPLDYQNILYLLKDGGLLTAMNSATGEILWRERVSDSGSRYFASPVAGDGKIFLAGEDGHISVVKAGREFLRLSDNNIGEQCYATPAIAGKFLLVRTLHTLWSFALKY
jgi:outer membrane protein assembly factor BamB